MNNCAILLAAGKGTRMQNSVKDKTLVTLFGEPVLIHSLRAFAESKAVSTIIFVCKDDEQIAEIKNLSQIILEENNIKSIFTIGGKERQDSVLNGLRACPTGCDIVFIHDSARPLVGAENISKLLEVAKKDGACVLANRVADTIKKNLNSPSTSQCELQDLERVTLWAMQTPQVFMHSEILRAYEKISAEGIAITDDIAAAAFLGIKVSIVENLLPNPKITLPQDIALAEYMLNHKIK